MLKRLQLRKRRDRLIRSRGDAARDAMDWKLAAALYEIYLSESSGIRDAPIWVQLGHARKESGDTAGALAAYLRSLEIAPDVADTHLQIGHLHKRDGSPDKAAASYLEASRLDPSLAPTSRHDLDTAVQEAPDASQLLARADRARDAGHWSEAASFYAEFLTSSTDESANEPIWVQLGHSRKEAGDSDGAVEAYERAIELVPDHAETYRHIGHLLKRMGAFPRAIAAFEEVLRLTPDAGDIAAELEQLWIAEPAAVMARAPVKAERGVQFAFPLPLPPGQVTFAGESPHVFAGLSRRFNVAETTDTSV